MSAGEVIIEREGAGFRVRTDPPDPRHPDATFDCIKRARGAAGGIRLVTGRLKRDLSGEA